MVIETRFDRVVLLAVRGSTLYHVTVSREQRTVSRRKCKSFPFNRAGRFRANVVDDAVDALDFGNNPGRDTREQLMRETGPIRRHPIYTCHGAKRNHTLVSPFIAHYTDR